jgi:hypothetical protein
MFKTFLVSIALMVSIGTVYANRSQLIILPDGTQMICYYYNDGRIVYCEKL